MSIACNRAVLPSASARTIVGVCNFFISTPSLSPSYNPQITHTHTTYAAHIKAVYSAQPFRSGQSTREMHDCCCCC